MAERRKPLDILASGVDQLGHVVALGRSERSKRASSAESLGPEERARALSAIRERYAPYVDDPDAFFRLPSTPTPEVREVRAFGDGTVSDLRWASEYVPFAEEVADGYLAWEENQRATARLFAHREPRPTIVLIHGYLGGNHVFEERAWPLGWLFDKGLDVVLFVLPLHGDRRAGGRPKFPSSDPRITIEGFRQMVWDFRSLRLYLVSRGASAVGAMGMSLGGYSTALLSTLVADLAFAIPFIPLASIADFARDGDRLVGTASQRRRQHALLEEALAVVSPLSRPSVVPEAGRLVVAARGDRITPPAHAKRLADHLDAPLSVFTGGHILQVGRKRGFRAVGKLLGGLGLLEG
jgi:pimeloyl-ACP methyl ester carboxylesterase